MTSSSDWTAALRSRIKQNFPLGGFTVREENGKVMLQKRWKDSGQRRNAALPFVWGEARPIDVLTFIGKVNEHLQTGMSLKEAVHLQWPVVGEAGTGPKASTNWPDLVDRFRIHKIQSGQVKESTWDEAYAYVMRELLEALAAQDAPTNGPALLTELVKGQPGSRGRVVRIERAAQFLTFAVKTGIDQRWRPPVGEELTDIKGRKAPNEKPEFANAGQAVPLMDNQFLALLDEIPDPRWKLAIGLCGVFGLRPVELNYIRQDGDRLWCEYQKRTARGCSPKRHIDALDPIERPGMGKQLLLELSSGVTALPPLGSSDAVAATRMNTYLKRKPYWAALRDEVLASGAGRLSAYSMRHGYAYRSAMTYNLPVRVAKDLMGHSLDVHMKHYGKWVDGATVQGAVEAARARVAAAGTARP